MLEVTNINFYKNRDDENSCELKNWGIKNGQNNEEESDYIISWFDLIWFIFCHFHFLTHTSRPPACSLFTPALFTCLLCNEINIIPKHNLWFSNTGNPVVPPSKYPTLLVVNGPILRCPEHRVHACNWISSYRSWECFKGRRGYNFI